MATSIFCICKNEPQTTRVVTRLKNAGFMGDDISVLFPDKSGSRDFAHEQHTKAPEGAVAGAASGGVVGGVVGLLAGIGLLAIPGLGPFIAAGPIAASLSGIAVGAAAGGIAGALIGMGIPELEAKRYEGKVKDGNILVSVHCDDGDQAKRAREIFEQEGTEDIVSGGEATPPKADSKVNVRTGTTGYTTV